NEDQYHFVVAARQVAEDAGRQSQLFITRQQMIDGLWNLRKAIRVVERFRKMVVEFGSVYGIQRVGVDHGSALPLLSLEARRGDALRKLALREEVQYQHGKQGDN